MTLQGLGPDAKVPLDDRPILLRASHFGPDGMLRLRGSRLARAAGAPIPGLFWAAGFSFSRSALLTEVRVDSAHAQLNIQAPACCCALVHVSRTV